MIELIHTMIICHYHLDGVFSLYLPFFCDVSLSYYFCLYRNEINRLIQIKYSLETTSLGFKKNIFGVFLCCFVIVYCFFLLLLLLLLFISSFYSLCAIHCSRRVSVDVTS